MARMPMPLLVKPNEPLKIEAIVAVTAGLWTAMVWPVPLAKVRGPFTVMLFPEVVPPNVTMLAALVTLIGE